MKSWLKISALALASLVLSAQTVSTGDKLHARLRGIGEKLKCQCTGSGGCAYTVGSCNMLNCHFRTEVYEQISQDLKAGVGEVTILEKLKQKYGTLILAEPPAQGFNLVGWMMPFLAMLLGLIVIRYLLARWRRPATAPAVSGAAIEKYRDQIEKEMADLE